MPSQALWWGSRPEGSTLVLIFAQMEGLNGVLSWAGEGDSLISLCLIGRTLFSVSSKDKNKQRS